MTPLNPVTVPLRGTQLIEASAGTGKTWTIASLFVRLVLEDDGPTGAPLDTSHILVLTFTRAATRELVERIRRRLVQCQQVLEGSLARDADDDFLAALMERHPPGAKRQRAVWRLERAAASMDAAAVATIDSWVQRVLRDEAQEVGAAEPKELLEDDIGLLRAACQDYWRLQVYPLNGACMKLLAEDFEHPEALLEWLKPAIRNGTSWPPRPQQPLHDVLGPIADDLALRLSHLKQEWAPRIAEIRSWFAERLTATPPQFNKQRIKAAQVDQWLDALEAWVQSDDRCIEGITLPDQRVNGKCRLLPQALMDGHLKAYAQAAPPPWALDFEQLVTELSAMPRALVCMAEHALGWVSARLVDLKRAAGTWTFDDRLNHLLQALDSDAGAAQRLRMAYPVALIDEFQDTSPRQFAVFDRIYDINANRQDIGLLLIGDPKQSIYRFRGADIHSYLAAKRMMDGRHHSLAVNRRSVPALVSAVNRLFCHAETREMNACGEGVFRHGADVPFISVGSCDRAEQFVGSFGPQPVLSIWTEKHMRTSAVGRDIDAARAAQRLTDLLLDEAAGFQDPVRGRRRVQPRDCCVIVRSGTEAAAVRRELSLRGVPSVYLSDRDLVVHTQEARDILELLRALLHPTQMDTARRLWAVPLLGLSWSEMRSQAADEALWDARLARLAEWRRTWSERGVLAAIRRFIQEESVPARAMLTPDGPRRLTNALHLAEWLQEAAGDVQSDSALVELLESAIISEGDRGRWPSGIQTHLVRLESDADVVQIVTIHKSKGLQYPIVFMPFVGSVREEKPGQWSNRLQFQEGRWTVTGHRDSDDAQALFTAHQREEAREDMRLLYVGMTRAVHQLWLGACPRSARSTTKSEWHDTAIGHLISGGQRAPEDIVADVTQAIAHLVQNGISARVEQLDTEEEPVRAWQAPEPTTDPRPALVLSGSIDRTWRITSYTALVKGAEQDTALPDSPAGLDWAQMRWDESAGAPLTDSAHPHVQASSSGRAAWHEVPSSAGLGQLLHELLEVCADRGFALQRDAALQEQIKATLDASAWSAQAAVLQEWLGAIVERPLEPWGVPLSGLQRARPELEFWLPLQRLDTLRLDAFCRTHLFPGLARPTLQSQHLRGLIMGYADLVFQHGPRHAVLDYKSNRLGSDTADYHPQALEAAVLQHRYDVQAALYLLALHRLLRLRLGSRYRIADHLGPAQFLFLRGIEHPGGGLLSIEPSESWLNPLDALVGHAEGETP